MKDPKYLRPFHSDQAVILIAEDEAMVQNIVRIALEGDGYFLLTAHDGEAALEISRSFPGTIHLLLTDITMPRLNGIELCRRIAKERPDCRVLIMSGNPREDGFRVPFLQKPFTLTSLQDSIESLLGPISALQ